MSTVKFIQIMRNSAKLNKSIPRSDRKPIFRLFTQSSTHKKSQHLIFSLAPSGGRCGKWKISEKPSNAGPEKWKSQRRAAAHVYKANVIFIKMCYENQFQLETSESARALRLLDQCPLVITILIHPTLPYPLNVHRFGEVNNERAVGERGGGMVLFLHQSEPHRLTSPEATFLAAHLACVRMLEIWGGIWRSRKKGFWRVSILLPTDGDSPRCPLSSPISGWTWPRLRKKKFGGKTRWSNYANYEAVQYSSKKF